VETEPWSGYLGTGDRKGRQQTSLPPTATTCGNDHVGYFLAGFIHLLQQGVGVDVECKGRRVMARKRLCDFHVDARLQHRGHKKMTQHVKVSRYA
jgi:hypothetical protein